MTAILSVPLASIDVPARLRPTDEAYVAGLADSMARIGQTDPVLLRPRGERYDLVAGAHRLAAAGLLGWTAIEATVREMDDLVAKLAEIDENLIRRELSPLDRAVFLAERKAVYEQLHPSTAHGGDRKSLNSRAGDQVANLATRYSEDVAERIGLSERTIWRAVAIVHALGRETLERLRGTPLADNQSELEKLAKLPEADRRTAVDALASGAARSLREALPRPEAPAGDVVVGKLIETWSRASRDERGRFLAHIGLGPAETQRLLDAWARRKATRG